MDLFKLPLQIRLEIFAYLFVKDDGIPIFCYTQGLPFVSDREMPFSTNQGLQPQLLRTNKCILQEASPLLYSKNKLSLLEMPLHEFAELRSGKPIVETFLVMIGSQARLVRHIALTLWTFVRDLDRANNTVNLDEWDRENLLAIQEMCPPTTTLEFRLVDWELSGHSLLELYELPETQLQLKTLASTLEGMTNPENVVLDIRVYVDEDDQEVKYDLANRLDEIPTGKKVMVVGNGNHRRKEIDDMESLALSYGWTVKVKRIKRRTWTTSDGECIVYSQEDLEAYKDDLVELELQRESERLWGPVIIGPGLRMRR
ncbi:hypothetical protein PG997_014725 [Apiospora hydei]|uniref:Uncharacterized protein n=1 Tax=Apiospora hydei TaxID=1337664 RepID=A0ABR1UXX1_9PEZI